MLAWKNKIKEEQKVTGRWQWHSGGRWEAGGGRDERQRAAYLSEWQNEQTQRFLKFNAIYVGRYASTSKYNVTHQPFNFPPSINKMLLINSTHILNIKQSTWLIDFIRQKWNFVNGKSSPQNHIYSIPNDSWKKR